MLSNTILLVGGYIAPVVAIWAGIVWIRPAVARARVEREVLLIRDRVVDGILNGEIDSDNPRARDAIMFCEFIADHSREITLTTAFITEWALRKSGVDTSAEARTRREKAAANAAGLATEAGERCLAKAEKDLDAALSTYLVRGSTALWWILAPMQRLLRLLSRRAIAASKPTPSEHLAAAVKRPFPGELASEVRESARGADAPPPWWTARGVGPTVVKAASVL